MSDTAISPAGRKPTVYFIDDSATMREVIKIAFRRESIIIVTCHDAASALAQFNETAPDVVITDVIMPDKDGYEVCQYIKQNSDLRKTPVILMSGVVNRTVAEKAIAVQADELIRKPFQPQELIARVKNLLGPKAIAAETAGEAASPEASKQTSDALAGMFSAPPSSVPPAFPPSASVAPRTSVPVPAAPAAPRRAIPPAPAAAAPGNGHAAVLPAPELQKLRREIQRLEMLVRKLQSDLEAERKYVASLEEHLKTLQEAE
jgi:CheY-like chemotaxis protein